MIGTHRPGRRGSAAVEFLILFPVLLLVIIAMLYLGDLSQFLLHTHFGADYAIHAAGDQSEARADRGTITSLFFPNPVGALTVAERPLPDGDLPRTGELRDMFDEMSEPIYSVRATGRYVLQNGQLRFIVHTHQDEALSAEGRYVQRYGLRDDQVPELTTDLTQGWAHRQRVDLDYSYEPDYIRVGKWPLEPVDLSARFESAVRSDSHREVTDPPPGMHHPIEKLTGHTDMIHSGTLPHFPHFGGDQAFWEPN